MDSGRDLPKGGVSPFGHPRINDRSHLPAAFRSVPRPSSPLGAKASTERPYSSSGLLRSRRHRPRAGPNRADQGNGGDGGGRAGNTQTNERTPQTNPRMRRANKRARAHPRTHNTSNPDFPVKEHGRTNERTARRPAPRARDPRGSPRRGRRTATVSEARRAHEDAQARADPGGDRVRTDDPLLAKQVLSRLSYAPARTRTAWAREDLNLRPHAYQACALTN